MTDTESLSAEDKAYFDTRGETVPAAPEPTESPAEVVEAEEEATPELVETEALDDDAEAGDEKPTGQSKVPLAALTKERAARKAEAARAAEAERKAAILEDRWNQVLLAQQRQPAAAEEAAPSTKPGTRSDPLAVLEKLATDAEKREQSEAERARQAKEAEAANEIWNKTLNVAREQFGAAASADETFEPTYQALRQNIAQEYVDVFGLTPQEAFAHVDQYEAQQIAFAVDRGIDVAAHMRKIAKTRNITVAPKKAEPTPAETLDKIAEGVNGSTSLSNAGGGRVVTTSAQSIADMSPEEFGAWLNKDGNHAKFRKLAGG